MLVFAKKTKKPYVHFCCEISWLFLDFLCCPQHGNMFQCPNCFWWPKSSLKKAELVRLLLQNASRNFLFPAQNYSTPQLIGNEERLGQERIESVEQRITAPYISMAKKAPATPSARPVPAT
jgi:hypothetical protein